MMASMAWALVRDDPTRTVTNVDRYMRVKHGGPNVAWRGSEHVVPMPTVERAGKNGVSERLLRHITQAIVAFF